MSDDVPVPHALKSPWEAITVPVASIAPSKTNPRRVFDKTHLEELQESIRLLGVLQPILVRPFPRATAKKDAPAYELIAGERRWRAAKALGLEDIPATVRELSDLEVLEIQLVENLQRTDLHPLEEAEGYRALMSKGYDVARIAERIGRSPKYVYDRTRLLDLTKGAKKIFLDGEITAGHAILLARLNPKDQERCIGEGLWTNEQFLFNPEEEDLAGGRDERLKPVSVRELQSWIDEHVRFEVKEADPVLFPETVATVVAATEEAEKIIPITHHHYIQEEARAEEKTWGPQSWRRADGRMGSKTCEYSITGVIAVGAGRGEAFKVCTAKEKCSTHWSDWQKERKARARNSPSTSGAAGQESARAKAARDAAEAKRGRWEKARGAILMSLAEKVKKAPATATGILGKVLLPWAEDHHYGDEGLGKFGPAGYVKVGTSAEDLVRHLGFIALAQEALDWDGCDTFPKRAKALFGLNLQAVLDDAVPPEKDEDKKKPKPSKAKPAKRKK